MKRKLLSLILILCMLFSIMSTGVSALENSKAEGSLELPITYDSFYGFNSVAYNVSYYNQLNAEQKNAYNRIVGLPIGQSTITVDLITDLTFTSQTNSPTDAETAAVSESIGNIIQPALNAFLKDYPIVFWIDMSGGANTTTYGANYEGQYYGGVYHWTVSQIQLYIRVDSKYSNATTYVNTAKAAVTNFSTTANDRYNKLKDIHNYLCNTVVYDLYATYAHEPYGALVDKKAVCEGYAEAFKLLCDKYSIPCALIVGNGVTNSGSEAHMWNYVQMEDNKWYGVDVTWDDQNTIRYDYFLSGSNTVAANFGTKTFSQSHIEDGNFSLGSSFTFTYPVLNSSAYVYDPCASGHTPGDWEVTVQPTYTSTGTRVKKCTVCGTIIETETIPMLVAGDAQLNTDSELSVSGTYLIGVCENSTVADIEAEFNGSITVTNNNTILTGSSLVGTGYVVDVGNTTYTIIILGDVDGNGSVTSMDYLMVKRAFLGTFTLTEIRNKAACISGGSSPASSDYLKIKRHVLGTFNIYA